MADLFEGYDYATKVSGSNVQRVSGASGVGGGSSTFQGSTQRYGKRKESPGHRNTASLNFDREKLSLSSLYSSRTGSFANKPKKT